MKTCPNCGSIIADNEPYCENCGFNPDYDMGSWNSRHRRTTKPYYHGDHIKDPDPYVFSKEIDWAFCIGAGIIALILSILLFYDSFLSWIWHNGIMVIVFGGIAVFGIFLIFLVLD